MEEILMNIVMEIYIVIEWKKKWSVFKFGDFVCCFLLFFFLRLNCNMCCAVGFCCYLFAWQFCCCVSVCETHRKKTFLAVVAQLLTAFRFYLFFVVCNSGVVTYSAVATKTFSRVVVFVQEYSLVCVVRINWSANYWGFW